MMLRSVLLLFGLIVAAPAPAAAPASAVVAVHALAAQAAAALPAADQAEADPAWLARMVRSCVRIGHRVSC